jgi:hypothetical protein
MPRNLQTILEAVNDEPTFVAFIEALGADFREERAIEAVTPSSAYGTGALGWENGTIDGFLESAVAWAMDSDADVARIPNSWYRCASILHAGKFYE